MSTHFQLAPFLPCITMHKEQKATVFCVIFMYVTSVLRLGSVGLLGYHLSVCSLANEIASSCNNTFGDNGQSTFNIIQSSSWYLESVTLATFIAILVVWPSFRIMYLARYHLTRTAECYSLGALTVTCLVLQPLSKINKHMEHRLQIVWLVGYELEIALYLVTTILLVHLEGPGIRSAVREIYSRKPSVRFTCYLSWWSFLSISVVHNAVFAAYTAVIVVSTLTGSRTTFAQIDVVSLLAQFALRWQLTKIFFRKFLDWPLPHHYTDEMRVHTETRISYDAL